MTGQGGEAVTLHRTYLTADGHKAPVDAPKKLMRHPSARQLTGGAIRLVPAGTRLAVTEGIETALAVIEATGIPAWATGNAHLLETFVPPPGVSQVLVFADKDRPSRQHPSGHGQEAARGLVTRLWAMGIRAGAIAPALDIPDGKKGRRLAGCAQPSWQGGVSRTRQRRKGADPSSLTGEMIMYGVIDFSLIDTMPGGFGPFAPPAGWQGDYRQYPASTLRW